MVDLSVGKKAEWRGKTLGKLLAVPMAKLKVDW